WDDGVLVVTLVEREVPAPHLRVPLNDLGVSVGAETVERSSQLFVSARVLPVFVVLNAQVLHAVSLPSVPPDAMRRCVAAGGEVTNLLLCRQPSACLPWHLHPHRIIATDDQPEMR